MKAFDDENPISMKGFVCRYGSIAKGFVHINVSMKGFLIKILILWKASSIIRLTH